MAKTDDYVRTFLNPAGFVEQNYVGSQTPQEIFGAIRKLGYYSKKLEESGQTPLILVDLSRVTKIDLSRRFLGARKAGIRAMRSLSYERAAICGSLPIQILVSTLALVAGVHAKVRVFDSRVDAVRWLRAR